MSKEFKLGDRVTHDPSKTVGRVVGLRKAEPYTVQVEWFEPRAQKKDWYKPEVLEQYVSKPEDVLADRLIEITDGVLIAKQYRELEELIIQEKEASYEEGYAFCQDTNGLDGPSS